MLKNRYYIGITIILFLGQQMLCAAQTQMPSKIVHCDSGLTLLSQPNPVLSSLKINGEATLTASVTLGASLAYFWNPTIKGVQFSPYGITNLPWNWYLKAGITAFHMIPTQPNIGYHSGPTIEISNRIQATASDKSLILRTGIGCHPIISQEINSNCLQFAERFYILIGLENKTQNTWTLMPLIYYYPRNNSYEQNLALALQLILPVFDSAYRVSKTDAPAIPHIKLEPLLEPKVSTQAPITIEKKATNKQKKSLILPKPQIQISQDQLILKKLQSGIKDTTKPTLWINLEDTIYIDRNSSKIGFNGYLFNAKQLSINGIAIQITTTSNKFYAEIPLNPNEQTILECIATNEKGVQTIVRKSLYRR